MEKNNPNTRKSLFYIAFPKETGKLKRGKTPTNLKHSVLRNYQEAAYMCINNNNNN